MKEVISIFPFFLLLFNHGHSLSPRIQDASSRSLALKKHFAGSNPNEPRDIRNSPGSDLFPGKGPYVPLGLSAEEYEQIKANEREKLSKMNFGAWGPRFKQGEVPQGDWMVMPSLWTNGNPQLRRNLPTDDNVYEGEANIGFRSKVASLLKKSWPGFVLGYIVVDIVATAIAMWRTSGLTVRQGMWMAFKLWLFIQRTTPLYIMMWKIQALKLALASLLTPWMCQYLEFVNRRKLWTKFRTILTTTGAGLAGLTLWATLLFAINRLQ